MLWVGLCSSFGFDLCKLGEDKVKYMFCGFLGFLSWCEFVIPIGVVFLGFWADMFCLNFGVVLC